MANVKYKKERFGIILCLLFFCEPFLSYHFLLFSYVDELIVLFFLLHSLMNVSSKVKKIPFYVFVLSVVLFVLVLFYNFQFDIQNSIQAIVLDAFNCSKFFIIAIYCEKYFKNINVDYFVQRVGKIFCNITYVLLILAIFNLFFDFGMRDGMRYGLSAFKFLCENAGQFNYCCYFLVTILTAYYFVMQNRSFNPIFASLILFALTLRARTFIFIGIYLFMFLYFIKAKGNNKYLISVFFICTLPLFYLASYSQVNKYFMNDNVARSRLLTDGIKVFKEYFPLGTGFATFGTAQAAEHYSPLYYKYGLNKVWGLYPDDPSFASDSFWPSIIAQFGFIGAIIYIVMLLMIFNFYRKKFENSKYKLTFYFIVTIIGLSSFVTASFYHYTTIGMIMIVAIISQKNS